MSENLIKFDPSGVEPIVARSKFFPLRWVVANRVEDVGYHQTANTIISASNLYEDWENFVDSPEYNGYGMDYMQEAKLSLTLDPSGFDLLDRWYQKYRFIYGRKDTFVQQFLQGVEFYKWLYKFAVEKGAVTDKKSSRTVLNELIIRGKIRLINLRTILRYARDPDNISKERDSHILY